MVLNGEVFKRFPYFIMRHRGTGTIKLVLGAPDAEDAMWFVVANGSAIDAAALAKVARIVCEIGQIEPERRLDD